MVGPQPGAPVVPEHARFCPACDGPVGRGRDGRPGRERGTCPWCRAMYDLRPALVAGDRLDGARDAYTIRAPWHPGTRGWLYAADPDADRAPVVLSRLEGPEGPAAGELAVTEPEVLVGLAVPGLVRARDVAATRGPTPSRYLVLEHVEGRSLDAAAPLAPVAALDAVLAVTAPLAALHAQGLLHADLTPANLLAGPAGVTLADLGSVRRVGDRTSDVWGTTGFLAPEITPGGSGPSVASEVYGLGRTLAVLLMRFDHTGADAMRLPPPERAPLLAAHPDLAALLARATHPDPDARHRTVDVFASAARAVRAAMVDTGHHDEAVPAPRDGRVDEPGAGAATP